MKKIIFAITGILFLAAVYAHPPRTVKLTYNSQEKKLLIEAVHKVSNVETHYIEEMTVFVNGIEREKITLSRQSSREAENYAYVIEDLNIGDIVRVTANCNKSGRKSAEITIQ